MSRSTYNLYVNETYACLQRAEKVIRSFNRDSGLVDAKSTSKAYCEIHAILGLAKYFSLKKVQKIAQMTECLIEELSRKRVLRNGSRIDLLLRSLQKIKELVGKVAQSPSLTSEERELFNDLRLFIACQNINLTRKFELLRDLLKRLFYCSGDQITTGPPRNIMNKTPLLTITNRSPINILVLWGSLLVTNFLFLVNQFTTGPP